MGRGDPLEEYRDPHDDWLRYFALGEIPGGAEDREAFASDLEERGRYQEAFWVFCLLADDGSDPDRQAKMWMKAARCLQKATPWRAQTGTWSALASALGKTLDTDVMSEGDPALLYPGRERERFDRFNVISDDEWDHGPDSCLSATDRRRYRQAWAYEWAAEDARAAGVHADAARLFRRAGWAWECSPRKDRWQRAASCFHSAAIDASITPRIETQRMVVEPWCPWCVREKSTEGRGRCPAGGDHGGRQSLAFNFSADDRFTWQAHSDVERIARSWSHAEGSGVLTTRECAGQRDRQLADVQRSLASHGRKADARSLQRYRIGLNVSESRWFRHTPLVGRPLRWLRTRITTSAGVLAVIVLGIYGLLLPVIWDLSGAVHVAGSASSADFLSCVVFSLQAMVTYADGFFAAGTFHSNLFAVLETVSAYFGLALIVWVALRSYAD